MSQAAQRDPRFLELDRLIAAEPPEPTHAAKQFPSQRRPAPARVRRQAYLAATARDESWAELQFAAHERLRSINAPARRRTARDAERDLDQRALERVDRIVVLESKVAELELIVSALIERFAALPDQHGAEGAGRTKP